MCLIDKPMTCSFWLSLVLSIVLAMHSQLMTQLTEASLNVGVCYGMVANNLPPPADVIALYKQYGFDSLRLFDPNTAALEALRKSLITVSLGVKNEDIQPMASSQDFANSWFAANVAPYLNDIVFEYITVGNEAIPGPFAAFIAAAMRNLQTILDAQNLAGISVTTVLSSATLGTSFPPSSGAFSDEASGPLVDILKFLSAQASPLMINVYPYFAYAGDPANVPLDYAQFTASGPVIEDGGLSYQNLFDAIVDAFYWAMERVGVADVDVVVSESGWPSAGNGNFTTPQLAATYNKNFIKRFATIPNGTPKRPQSTIQGYIFAMFNENEKPAGVEQNFGLFDPTVRPVKPVYPFIPPV